MSDIEEAVEVQNEPVQSEAVAESTPDLTPHQQFLEMLSEDMRSDPNFVDFKGENVNEIVGKLAKSYVNTKKLVGADKEAVLKIPGSEDDVDGWNAVYSKLGRPENSKGYGVDEIKKNLGIEGDYIDKIADAAFENGVSKKAFNKIIETYAEQTGLINENVESETKALYEKYDSDLREAWGGAYDQKVSKVQAALKNHADPAFLELAAENPHLFDHPSVLKTIDNLVKLSAEDSGPVTASGSAQGALTPAEAKAQIAAMEGDAEKMKAIMTPGHPMRETILAERERLFKYAYQ